MVPVEDFQILFDNETNEREQVFIRWPNVTIHWPGGRTGPPRDSPECGFHGELCIEPKGEGENFLFNSFFVCEGFGYVVMASINRQQLHDVNKDNNTTTARQQQ